jgi:hypothetical protein
MTAAVTFGLRHPKYRRLHIERNQRSKTGPLAFHRQKSQRDACTLRRLMHFGGENSELGGKKKEEKRRSV